MLAVLRKEKIKSILYNEKIVSVSTLATQLHVTDETIRRDLSELEDEGFLIRKHGGAILSHKVQTPSNNYDLKNVFVKNKQIIAEISKTLIQPGDCIFLDSSTTAYYIAKEISEMKLTVVTNSLSIINLLVPHKQITLIVIGGTIQTNRSSFNGHCAVNFLKNFYVDKAIISCRSLDMNTGITEATEEFSELKKTAIKQANQTILAVDYSKFDKTSFIKTCDFSSINDIITDKPLSSQWAEFLKSQNVKLWIPKTQ